MTNPITDRAVGVLQGAADVAQGATHEVVTVTVTVSSATARAPHTPAGWQACRPGTPSSVTPMRRPRRTSPRA